MRSPTARWGGTECRGARFGTVLMLAVLVLAPGLFMHAAAQERPPVPVILDTDMESDVDDVGALAMLHALADRGETEILGVMVSAKNPHATLTADRINTYFGRGDLPLGQLKGEGVDRESRYAHHIAEEFPGQLAGAEDAPDAVALYREILAGQTDDSVVLVTIGYKTNVRDLLASGPCEHSELDGRELAAQKFRIWICMGGQFPSGREANIFWDARASAEAIENWPTDIIFNGWEIGRYIHTGGGLAELPEDSPVRRSYQLFNNLRPHRSWDQAALLYAVRGLDDGPAADYWDLSPPGRIVINPEDGKNTWEDDPDGTHRHHIARRDPELVAEEIDVLMIHVPAEPVRIIFDTDMDTDCDDAGALAMLHALADKREVEILATLVSSKFDWSVPCTQAINAWYGRTDLPIGSPLTGEGADPGRGSRFAREITEEFQPQLKSNADAPDAVEIYRRVLAVQPDNSVVIVTVGYLTNLRHLLDSKADEHSPLSGVALVERKVREWVCMGSRYPADLDPGVWGNFKPDPKATVEAVNRWPTLITFTGGGGFARSLSTGQCLSTTPEDNPVRRAYELYFGREPRNRHSADQIAVLVAVRGTEHRYWELVTEGHNHIFPNGTHEWREQPDNPKHRYISALAEGVGSEEVTRAIEELMVRPPALNGGMIPANHGDCAQ